MIKDKSRKSEIALPGLMPCLFFRFMVRQIDVPDLAYVEPVIVLLGVVLSGTGFQEPLGIQVVKIYFFAF
jgi:hypothetical protein